MAWNHDSKQEIYDKYKDQYPWMEGPYAPIKIQEESVLPQKTAPSPKPFPRRTETVTATATAIDNFEKTVKQHVAKDIGNVETLFEQIEKVKTTNPTVYDEGKIKVFLTQRAKALNVLIDSFLVAKITSKYPLLDNDIFSLKRHIYLSGGIIVEDSTAVVKATAVHVEIPLFVHVDMNIKRVELEKFSKSTSTQKITTTLSAAVPEPPPEVVELGHKSLGFYHGILAEIYSSQITSDLFVPEASPTLETMWIPTLDSVKVKVNTENIPAPKSYDPALLLKHRGRYYLVGLWDIKEELPFEGILREFTVGDGKFPKKK